MYDQADQDWAPSHRMTGLVTPKTSKLVKTQTDSSWFNRAAERSEDAHESYWNRTENFIVAPVDNRAQSEKLGVARESYGAQTESLNVAGDSNEDQTEIGFRCKTKSKQIDSHRKQMQYLSDTLKTSNCESLIMIYNTELGEVQALGSKIGKAFCKSWRNIDITFKQYCQSYLLELDRLSEKVDTGKSVKSEPDNAMINPDEELKTDSNMVTDNIYIDNNLVVVKTETVSDSEPEENYNTCTVNMKNVEVQCDSGPEMLDKMETNQAVYTNPISTECTEDVSKSKRLKTTNDKNQGTEKITIKNSNEVGDDIKLEEAVELKSALIESKTIEGNLSYSCKLCPTQVVSYNEIEEHISKHLRDDPFICKLCGKRFKGKKTLWRHTNSHKVLPHQCDVCMRMFKTVDKLDDHQSTHSLVHTCNLCERTYDSVSRLNFHKKTAHGPKQNICETCGASFTCTALLKQHKIRHGPKLFFCNLCSSSYFFDHELQCHLKTHDEQSFKYKCNVCPREYVNKSRLNEHMKIHDGNNFVKCDICDQSYNSRKSLNLHKLSLHSGEKKYVCQICGKAFSYKHHLSNHLISHSDTRAFKCRYCDATFKKNDILKMHENVHTEEKKFVCDVCGQHFLRRSSLRNHRLKHMSGPGHLKCRYCNDKFQTRTSMLTHVKNKHIKVDLCHDKPMCRRCELCNKVFADSRTYKIHLNMHAGTKNHKCSVCDSSFTDPANLRAHMKKHNSTSKRHKCHTCELTFATGRQCAEHVGKHMESITETKNDSPEDARKTYPTNTSPVGTEFHTMNNITHSLVLAYTCETMCSEVYTATVVSTNASPNRHGSSISMTNIVNDSVTAVSDGIVQSSPVLNDSVTAVSDGIVQSSPVLNDSVTAVSDGIVQSSPVLNDSVTAVSDGIVQSTPVLNDSIAIEDSLRQSMNE